MIERGQVAFEDVLAIASLGQQVRSAPPHHIDAMVDEVFDRLDQPHFLGLTVDHGQQNHAEAFLHRGVLEELVEHDLRFGAALEFDHDAHAVAIAFVANVGDVVDGLLVDEIGDALDEARFIHLVRNLGDDDRLLFFGDVLDGGAGAHHETAAARPIRLKNPSASVNDRGRRKIRSLHEFQNLRQLRGGIIHQGNRGIDDLGQVVRRNLRGHADGDAIGAVDEQVGKPRGKNRGLRFRAVVVRIKVDCFFVKIFEQRGGDARQSRFGVSIGCRRVAIDRAEVALTIDQRRAHGEGLRQSHQRIVDGQVSVRMVLAHHFADDASALARGSPGSQAHLLHGVKNAAMHGLQSVAYVGQSAADNHRQGIVEIRPLHLVFNVDGLHVEGARTLSVASGRRS